MIYVHFSGFNFQGITQPSIAQIELSKNPIDMSYLPCKILSIKYDDMVKSSQSTNQDSCANANIWEHRLLEQYILSDSIRKCWQYPFGLSSESFDNSRKYSSQNILAGASIAMDDDVNVNGKLSGAADIPTAAQSLHILNSPVIHKSQQRLKVPYFTIGSKKRVLSACEDIAAPGGEEEGGGKTKHFDDRNPSEVDVDGEQEADNDTHNSCNTVHYIHMLGNMERIEMFPITTQRNTKANIPFLPLKVIGIDCEMCDTEDGLEVTRVSIIAPDDSKGCGKYTTIIDAYIKPYKPITDYREQFSGINQSILEPVNIRLEQIQVLLLSLTTQDTVFIGHSLENDLRALRICHDRCIDTSVLYPHPRGFPYRQKLKHLTQSYLNRKIQHKSSGHDSLEDARCTMDLVLKKLTHGSSFGVKNSPSPRIPFASLMHTNDSIHFIYCDEPNMNQQMRWCELPSTTTTDACASNEQVLTSFRTYISRSQNHSEITSKRFLFLGFNANANNKNVALSGMHNMESAFVDKTIVELKKQIHDANSCNPSKLIGSTLLIATNQSANLQDAIDLMKQKKACSSVMSASMWSLARESQLQSKIQECRSCQLLVLDTDIKT